MLHRGKKLQKGKTMFKKLLKYLGKTLGLKPATLGDGLKAFKKRYGVIEDISLNEGERCYRCKDGRTLLIATDRLKPVTSTGLPEVPKRSSIKLSCGVRTSDMWNGDVVTRNKTVFQCGYGRRVLVSNTKETLAGKISSKPIKSVQKTYCTMSV